MSGKVLFDPTDAGTLQVELRLQPEHMVKGRVVTVPSADASDCSVVLHERTSGDDYEEFLIAVRVRVRRNRSKLLRGGSTLLVPPGGKLPSRKKK